jgi:hypothetical protein
MTTYVLARSGDVDLEFDGEILANESSRGEGIVPGRPDRSANPRRWAEVRIYKLASGNGWVTEYVGKSAYPGEVDRPRVAVCRTPEEVREALKTGRSYLTNIAVDALAEAAEADPRLRAVTRERI